MIATSAPRQIPSARAPTATFSIRGVAMTGVDGLMIMASCLVDDWKLL